MADLEATLDGMLKARQVGLIEWEGDGACFYHFFTFRSSTAQTATRDVIGSRERDYEQTNVLVRKRHDLIDAKALPLPAPKVGRPRRVEAVLGTLPEVLASLIRLVAGTQIRQAGRRAGRGRGALDRIGAGPGAGFRSRTVSRQIPSRRLGSEGNGRRSGAGPAAGGTGTAKAKRVCQEGGGRRWAGIWTVLWWIIGGAAAHPGRF